MAGGEMITVCLRLVKLVRIIAPKAAVSFQKLGGIFAGRARRHVGPVGIAVGVGGRTRLDVKLAVAAESKGLGLMLTLIRQAGDHGLGFARRDQLAGSQFVAIDRAVARVVKPVAAQSDARAAAGTELLFLLEAAVTVFVAQRNDATEGGFGVDITVRRDGKEAQLIRTFADLATCDEIVRHDQRPETRR